MTSFHMNSTVAVNNVDVTVMTYTDGEESERIESTIVARPDVEARIFDHTITPHSDIASAVSYHLDCVQRLQNGQIPTLLGWIDARLLLPVLDEDDLLRALSPEEAFIEVFED